jgi:hypothetical protein
MLFGHNAWDAVTTDGFETNAPISEGIQAPAMVNGMPIYVITELDQPVNGRKYLIDFANAGLGAKSRAELTVESAKASAANPPASFGVPSGYWLDKTEPYSGPEDTDDGTTTDVDEDVDDAADDGSDDAGNGTAATTTGSAAGSTAKYAAIGGIALIGVLAVTKMGKRKA